MVKSSFKLVASQFCILQNLIINSAVFFKPKIIAYRHRRNRRSLSRGKKSLNSFPNGQTFMGYMGVFGKCFGAERRAHNKKTYNSLPILNRMRTLSWRKDCASSASDVIYTHTPHPAPPWGNLSLSLYFVPFSDLKKVKMASSSSFCGDCGVGCGSDGFGPKPQPPYLLTTTTVKEKLKKRKAKVSRKKKKEETRIRQLLWLFVSSHFWTKMEIDRTRDSGL